MDYKLNGPLVDPKAVRDQMQMRMVFSDWLGVKEAADLLLVTPRQVRRLASLGKIASSDRLGVLMLERESVLEYRQARGFCNRYGVRGGKLSAERHGVRL